MTRRKMEAKAARPVLQANCAPAVLTSHAHWQHCPRFSSWLWLGVLQGSRGQSWRLDVGVCVGEGAHLRWSQLFCLDAWSC